ncbi:arylsulfatase [Flavobacteriaceae bacterium]|nr:arylsulfatase [Flavobacteriaceae bacterium]
MKKSFHLLLLLLIFMLLSCRQEMKSAAPNIIYVLADDLGYGDLGVFNKEGKIQTPHLDHMARQGMIFTDAHTSSAVCTPTRYGILTGRYNWRSALKRGVLSGTSQALIPRNRTTVASFLKYNGYQTAFIGKWHLGWDWALKDSAFQNKPIRNQEIFEKIDFTKKITNSPNGLGFDYAYGHCGSLDMPPYVYVENEKITAQVENITERKGDYHWWRKGPTANDFDHERVTPHLFDKAEAYVSEMNEKGKPFFLYLPLPSPHTPILPTEEWKGKSGLNPYADFVMQIDHRVGRLNKLLDELGISDNTIVIFTSDNGCSPEAKFEVLGEKGHDPSGVYRGHKADIFEGGHRVPFIVKWPRRIQAGMVSQKTICTTDLLATCADILGEKLSDDEGEDSFSMLPTFSKVTESDYQRSFTIHHSINGSFAIRKGAYKFIFCPGSGGWSYPRPSKKETQELPKFQLYNLKEDPEEMNNLYGQHPKIENEMITLFKTAIKNGRTSPGIPQKNFSTHFSSKKWEPLAIFEEDEIIH